MVEKIKIEYRLFFQRRSGGHAIVEWIASHFKKPGVLINSLRPTVKWNRHPTKYWNIKYPYQHGSFCVKNEKQLKEYEKGKLKIKHKFVITTYEDPLRYFTELYRNGIDGVESRRIISIIVIRDIYNHIASRLKFDKKRKKSQSAGWYEDCVSHWKNLILNKSFQSFCLKINYNKWLQKRKYRIAKGAKLRLPNNYGCINKKIHSYGSGSSFTGIREEANVKLLNERWKMYIEEFGITPTFQKILNDKKLQEINLNKFGWALDKKGRLIQ